MITIIFSETTIRMVSENIIQNLTIIIVPLIILVFLYFYLYLKFKIFKNTI